MKLARDYTYSKDDDAIMDGLVWSMWKDHSIDQIVNMVERVLRTTIKRRQIWGAHQRLMKAKVAE